MKRLMLSEIASMLGGKLIGEDRQIEKISTDSRKIDADTFFIALNGQRFDAHDFVESIADKAGGALVHRQIDCELPQVLVNDTLKSLGIFAAELRKQFKKPLIGLTGSNGKTTVKEMLSTILSEKGNVLSTLGNLNNDIGMPLTLLGLNDAHDYAVIEMGANHFGEIDYLTNIANPDVAILNNAGAAHLEGFGSVEGVSRAKAEIFAGLSNDGVAVINIDDQYGDYWINCNEDRKILRFGFNDTADVQGSVVNGSFHITYAGETIEVNLELPGHHNQMNALAASAAAIAVGVDLPIIKQGLESIEPVKGRLAPASGIRGIHIINDTYNANPNSAKAAINVLAGYKKGQRLLVLGDMGELGNDTKKLHADVGGYARSQGIEKMYCLGTYSQHACQQFGVDAHGFDDIDPLIECLKQELEEDMTILVKGSRSMRMERVVEALSVQTSQESAAC